MDINLIKIIPAILSAIFILYVGIRVLILKSDNLLNRWFFIFFISSSMGFLFYAIYHAILFNAQAVIPLMITAQILFNFTIISLVMTVFCIEKYEKVAMSIKYFGSLMVIYLIMILGYFIPGLTPELDMAAYSLGIVNTITEPTFQIFVNLIRFILIVYVLVKYAMINRKTGEDTKSRIKLFFIGILIAVIGLFINLFGGLFEVILIEILALFLFIIGSFLIFRGFK